MISPKVSRSTLARAFAGGSILVEKPPRPQEVLPVSHRPAPAPPAALADARGRRAPPLALCLRLVGAVFIMYHSQHGSQALTAHIARWDVGPPVRASATCAIVPFLSTVDGVVLLLSLAIAGDAAVWAGSKSAGATATACRHAAGVLVAYSAAGVMDAAVIAAACVAVTCWPCGAGGHAPRATWLMAWLVPVQALALGFARGGSALPLAAAVVGWAALAVDARADRSAPAGWGRSVHELACEACIVAGAVGTIGVFAFTPPACSGGNPAPRKL